MNRELFHRRVLPRGNFIDIRRLPVVLINRSIKYRSHLSGYEMNDDETLVHRRKDHDNPEYFLGLQYRSAGISRHRRRKETGIRLDHPGAHTHPHAGAAPVVYAGGLLRHGRAERAYHA